MWENSDFPRTLRIPVFIWWTVMWTPNHAIVVRTLQSEEQWKKKWKLCPSLTKQSKRRRNGPKGTNWSWIFLTSSRMYVCTEKSILPLLMGERRTKLVNHIEKQWFPHHCSSSATTNLTWMVAPQKCKFTWNIYSNFMRKFDLISECTVVMYSCWWKAEIEIEIGIARALNSQRATASNIIYRYS